MTKLFETSWDIWEFRNAIKHSTSAVGYLRAQAAAHDSIDMEINQGTTGLLPRDHYRLHPTTVQDIKRGPLEVAQRWLESMSAARARAVRVQEERQARWAPSRQIMERWLAGGVATPRLER